MMAIDLWASSDEDIHNAALGALRVVQRVGVDCRLNYKGVRMTVTEAVTQADIVGYFDAHRPLAGKA